MTSDFRDQQSAFVASTVFRVAPGFQAAALVSQLPRRERWVFLPCWMAGFHRPGGALNAAQRARCRLGTGQVPAPRLHRVGTRGEVCSVKLAMERLCPVSPTSMRQSCVMRFFFLYQDEKTSNGQVPHSHAAPVFHLLLPSSVTERARQVPRLYSPAGQGQRRVGREASVFGRARRRYRQLRSRTPH